MEKGKIEELINEITAEISELPFDQSVVELTNFNSIKFTLQFGTDKLLMLTKPLDELSDVKGENTIVFSYFKDRELIVSNVADLSHFISGFKKFLCDCRNKIELPSNR